MSLWWAKREQLDDHQVDLIENLPHMQNYLIVGPPGSGKTNVLLRRAQFVRMQGFPRVKVITFTRALTEFVKTGCYDGSGKEIFPRSLVTTLEKWIRELYAEHGKDLPQNTDFKERKIELAKGALALVKEHKLPKYDVLFVDEAQDLMADEVELLAEWAKNLFFVGDSRQKIYEHSGGLEAVSAKVLKDNYKTLPFHYRICPEICAVADRVLNSTGDKSLLATQHYSGPTPGKVDAHGPLDKHEQISSAADRLADQIRVYAGLIDQGDRLGVVVPRTSDREMVLQHFEQDHRLAGKAQIIRARSGEQGDKHDPELDASKPICILTAQGVKGLEFRALHWLFCDDLQFHQTSELYYTVITRAKTRLDFYFTSELPAELAQAYSSTDGDMW